MKKFSKNHMAFAGLWAASLLIGARPLFATLALSARNDEYMYLLLILPISASLIFLDRPWSSPMQRWDFCLSPIFTGAAVAISACTVLLSNRFSSDVQLAIYMIALVLSWIGIFVFCFGGMVARSMIFPLLFLFGLVPYPRRVMDLTTALLQEGSSWSAHVLFAAFGVPVVQQGNFLTIPGLTIQVVQECSSIRSSSVLLVTAIVLAQILLRSSWRKGLVIGLTIPLAVAKNGLRIFTIAILGTRVDPGYLTGRLHHQGGILFFIIALIGVFGVLVICQKGEGASLTAS